MNTTTGTHDVTQLITVADQLAASLATDGLLCGPAAPQDDASALVVTDDLRGACAELSDGTTIVVIASSLGAGRIAGTDEINAVVAALTPSLEAAAAALGRPIAATRPVIDVETMTAALNPVGSEVTLVGAGIFDGDQAIAAVGIRADLSRDSRDSRDSGDSGDSASPVDPFGAAAAPAPAAPTPRPVSDAARNLHLLADVTLGVTAELGSTSMTMGNLLDLQPGGVIELDREAGTPIDVLVNGTLIAKGEVIVIDSHYAVRVTEVITDGERR